MSNALKAERITNIGNSHICTHQQFLCFSKSFQTDPPGRWHCYQWKENLF